MSIITHSDSFHCDDVFSVALLKMLFPDYEIIRTRDMQIIKTGTIVVDVGLEYNAETCRFDHHQTSFNQKFNEDCPTPMSSFGLVWKHYGRKLCNETIYNKFYYKFVMPIDANDNGIANGNYYTYVPYEIHLIIGNFNSNNSAEQLGQFLKAVELATTIINVVLNNMIKNYEEFQKYLEHFETAFESRQNQEYIYLDKEYYVNPYLNKFDWAKVIKFVIVKRSENEYRILTINKHGKRFDIIAPIKFETHDDIIFIHKNLFIGATKTYEKAVKIVEESLADYYYKKSWTYYLLSKLRMV